MNCQLLENNNCNTSLMKTTIILITTGSAPITEKVMSVMTIKDMVIAAEWTFSYA